MSLFKVTDPLRWTLNNGMVTFTGTVTLTGDWNPVANDRFINLPFPVRDYGYQFIGAGQDWTVVQVDFAAGNTYCTIHAREGSTWHKGVMLFLSGLTYSANV